MDFIVNHALAVVRDCGEHLVKYNGSIDYLPHPLTELGAACIVLSDYIEELQQ
jgi:hypothetical protein